MHRDFDHTKMYNVIATTRGLRAWLVCQFMINNFHPIQTVLINHANYYSLYVFFCKSGNLVLSEESIYLSHYHRFLF